MLGEYGRKFPDLETLLVPLLDMVSDSPEPLVNAKGHSLKEHGQSKERRDDGDIVVWCCCCCR